MSAAPIAVPGPERITAATLLPCPFCGAAPALERHPSLPAAQRISCADRRCGVRPATEYLLEEFRAELAAAWNGRRDDDVSLPGRAPEG